MKKFITLFISMILISCGPIQASKPSETANPKPDTTAVIEKTSSKVSTSIPINFPSPTLNPTSIPTKTDTAEVYSWTYLGPNRSSNDQVRIIAIDPTKSTNIYIGVQNRGLLKSSDGGTTWVEILTQHYANPNIIAIDPISTSTVYYIDIPILKSTDGGNHWSDAGIWGINEGSYKERVEIRSFAINQKNPLILFAGVDYFGGIPAGNVYKSLDGGNNWTPINLPKAESVLTIAIDPINSQIVYAGTTDIGIYKSIDGGENWKLLSSLLSQDTIYYLAIDPIETDTIYAATLKNGIIKSDNGGENWRSSNNGIPDKLEIPKIILNIKDPKNIYIFTLDYSPDKKTTLYKSNDAGQSWMPINVDDKLINDVAVDLQSPPTLYIATDTGLFSMDVK
jgi:photosystem II stability/assembly factor-like uncharacterized protein